MLKQVGMCLVMLASACATEADESDEADAEQSIAEPAGARQAPIKPAAESCKLAEELGCDKLAVRSCLAGAPINAGGTMAEVHGGPAITEACNTYYGNCSGGDGCSSAIGGGWEYTACGSFLYAWMTICDGHASAWGTGFCVF